MYGAGHEGGQAAWQQACRQGPTVCAWHAGQHDGVPRYTHNCADQAPPKCYLGALACSPGLLPFQDALFLASGVLKSPAAEPGVCLNMAARSQPHLEKPAWCIPAGMMSNGTMAPLGTGYGYPMPSTHAATQQAGGHQGQGHRQQPMQPVQQAMMGPQMGVGFQGWAGQMPMASGPGMAMAQPGRASYAIAAAHVIGRSQSVQGCHLAWVQCMQGSMTNVLFHAGHGQAARKTLQASGQGKGPAAGPQGLPPGYGMPYWGMPGVPMQPVQPMQGQMMPGQMPPTYSMPQQFGMLQQQLPGIQGGPGHIPVHRQAGVQIVCTAQYAARAKGSCQLGSPPSDALVQP